MQRRTLKKWKYSKDLIGSAESRKPGTYTTTPAYKVLQIRDQKEASRKKFRQEERRRMLKSEQHKKDRQRAIKYRLRLHREAAGKTKLQQGK